MVMKNVLEIALVILISTQMLGAQRHMIGNAGTSWCGIQVTAGNNAE